MPGGSGAKNQNRRRQGRKDVRSPLLGRRDFLRMSAGAAAVSLTTARGMASPGAGTIHFGLTPVLLTSDLNLLDLLQSYLESASGLSVELVTRRTYQEISALLISSQLDGAWICSPPFLTYQAELELLAVPIWNGKPLYRSYLIADAHRQASSIDDLAGDIHAFSDPDSNSGHVATAAELAAKGIKPERFFRQVFYTYGHENVVRAVASGLAQSGSVDGYVYEVLKEVEPALTSATRVVRPSPWYGFPPIAGPRAAVGSEKRDRLRNALLTMHEDGAGQKLLKALRLDRLADEPPSLFDSVAANMALIRKIA
jgi:phosphonate transport system substrate-binding protein